jgi:hypothetical protein
MTYLVEYGRGSAIQLAFQILVALVENSTIYFFDQPIQDNDISYFL